MSIKFVTTWLLIFLFSPFCFSDQPVTFTEHIAPILFENCTSCHRPGRAAPFSLKTYNDARRRSRTIARVVESRYMPPWMPHGGDIPFKGVRRLTDEQVDLIGRWVEQGRPEGDPALLPTPPVFPSAKWDLGEPDMVVEMAEHFPLPADGPDIYRDFVLPTKIDEKKYVKAIAFLPGNRSVVHHSLVYYKKDGEADQFIGGWVPGTVTRYLPEGHAMELPPGGNIVISTHFHLSGKPETEKSAVGLYFSATPPKKEMAIIQLPPHFGILTGFDIPPGARETELTDKFVLPVDMNAFGVYGHTHYLGKSVSLTAIFPDGKKLKLLNIPDWDFNWQENYAFEEFVFLPKGTQLISRVKWDNTAENPNNPFNPPKRVRWGKESFDEMAELDLWVSLNDKREKKILEDAYKKHLAQPWLKHAFSSDMMNFADQAIAKAMQRFDLDGDGYLNKNELRSARSHLRKTTSSD